MNRPSFAPASAAPAEPAPKTHYEIRRKLDSVRCWAFREAGIRAPLYHPSMGAHAGFDLGHMGRGATDLAAAILADHTGARPSANLARAFAASFLAHSAYIEGRDLSIEQIDCWLAYQLAASPLLAMERAS